MDENLELIEAERKRLLEELGKCTYGSEDSKVLLQDLKDLSVVANEAERQKIEVEKAKAEAEAKSADRALAYEKSKQESEDKAQERKTSLITAWIDAGAKIVIAGTTVVVCVLNNESVRTALKEVLNYESGGEYITSVVGRSVIGGLFKRK